MSGECADDAGVEHLGEAGGGVIGHGGTHGASTSEHSARVIDSGSAEGFHYILQVSNLSGPYVRGVTLVTSGVILDYGDVPLTTSRLRVLVGLTTDQSESILSSKFSKGLACIIRALHLSTQRSIASCGVEPEHDWDWFLFSCASWGDDGVTTLVGGCGTIRSVTYISSVDFSDRRLSRAEVRELGRYCANQASRKS